MVALSEIGPRAGSFGPRLRRYLRSANANTQLNAAWALWRVSPKDVVAARATLRRLLGVDNYPLELIGRDGWGHALSDSKRKQESYPTRFAAIGALWQMDEKARPALAAALADLLRDWDFFTSMQHITPEESKAVPVLTTIEKDPAYAMVHEAARKAKGRILGNPGER